ncbi:receptor kinase-like protein Xa21 [Oryza glaberrima]|nr:receptor kinase-like protein Xa21 [Oryza glaberrima]
MVLIHHTHDHELLLLAIIIFLSCSNNGHASPASPSSSTTTNVTDRLALMSFRSLIRSDPTQALASWGNQSIPMCQWRGVACGLSGRRTGRVVALDLTKLNLVGAISPLLGNLTYLRRLHLHKNRLHGEIPSELGHLRDLRHLNLSYNSIQGLIPATLSTCRGMENIWLYSNKLQGQIPSEFESLQNLQALVLGENRLTGSIPSFIGSLANLKFLILEENNFTGEIPSDIGRLANLTVLGLGSNKLSGPIPASIGNLSALQFLSVFSNNLVGSIPPMQRLSSLEFFELGKNNIEGSIPTWLGNLSSLLTVKLGGNRLDGNIPESLGKLKLLTSLDLSSNNLVGPVPDTIGNLYSIKQFHVENNELEGSLPSSIFNLSSLEELNLQTNNLNGTIPLDLGNRLPKLQLFLISENQFHGSIPPSLCNISTLRWIQTVNNSLSGTIPQCIGINQKSLYSVTFAVNQFETSNKYGWSFMSSLTNCSNLRLLDVGDNKLTGELPNSIGNLSTRLEYFVTNYNSMTGKIPEGLGNLVSLKFIEMNNNFYEGTIPDSLGKLKNLNRLYLTNNNLSGSIPSSIGNLRMLTILSVAGNALSGEIPPSLSNCPLEQLELSYNNLTGLIPKELFAISVLSTSLILDHNFITGPLPSEVGNLTNLALLDFSSNLISGEIPSSIGECQSLQYLNTSGNLLQGQIPPSLDQLKGLLVLDLSHNNLSGSIPKFLGTMTGLASLNLSFNNFEGDVPKDGIFSNATPALIEGNNGLCNGIPQLKLPPCSHQTTKHKKQTWKIAMAISICSTVLFMAVVATYFVFHKRAKKTNANRQTSLIKEQHMRVSYTELAEATKGFTSENLIGAGSFGSVYKGRMKINDQQVAVAVKVFNLKQRGSSKSFAAECETLRCVRHRNLVKVLTVCSSIDFQGRDFKAIVYKFLPNRNLDQWLHQNIMEDGEHKALDLITRLEIAIDVASSLEYLHQYKASPIIHCDLKPSNVLLDDEMVAHVGDFGLARFLHQDPEQSSGWASMRGTTGYAAPEYGLGNEVSIHGDVYSYGILLLEMFSGKRPTDSKFGESLGLHNYVNMALPDRTASVIDLSLLEETVDGEAKTSKSNQTREMRIACITSILHVGVSCSVETPTDRMPIGDALKELQRIRDKFHRELQGAGATNHQDIQIC